ncbi:hypothetical protein H1R20_g3996, partial [Candolleomyces eurysporus]
MANGTSTLQGLLRELDELQSRISSSLARESAVVAEIKQLRPDFNPPEPPYANLTDPARLRAQLDAAKHELGMTKRELDMADHELATERKMRQDLQRFLDDIRREAKEPFIIPGLLDAFLSISSLAAKIH